MNLPNVLTLSRIGFAVLIVYFLSNLSFNAPIAAVLFFIAAITDFYDGYLAKKWNQVSNFGKIMDPIADKILLLSVFYAFAAQGLIVWWMVNIVAAREVLVTLDRLCCIRKGRVLAAETAGKIKTVFQMITVGTVFIILMFFRIHQPALDFMNIMMLITVVITIYSGISYFQNRFKGKA